MLSCFFTGCTPASTNDGVAEEVTYLPVVAEPIIACAGYEYPVTYYGRIESARTAAVGFEQMGKLADVYLDEGARVSKGGLLAKLNTDTLLSRRAVIAAELEAATWMLRRIEKGEREEVIAAAEAESSRLATELRLAEAEKDRHLRLSEMQANSPTETERAITEFESSKFAHQRGVQILQALQTGNREEDIEAQRSRVKAIAAKLAEIDLAVSKSELRAPFDAICTQRLLDEGVVVAAGTPVLVLQEADRFKVRFAVPAEVLGELERAIIVDGNGNPLAVHDSQIIPVMHDGTRSVDVIFELSYSGHQLFNGQGCSITVNRLVPADCYKAPLSAMVSSVRGTWACYSLEAAEGDLWRVVKHMATMLYTDGDAAYFAADLPASALVVTEGSNQVAPQMLVRRVEAAR